MRSQLSEFAYGYAITSELAGPFGQNLTAAPYFPSLREEGNPRGDQLGGYDVLLSRPGAPLFLQFKLSDYVRANPRSPEIRSGQLVGNFYRMHLRPSRSSHQHQMLLDLDQRGHQTYYIAPVFHTEVELNRAYINGTTLQWSRYFAPCEIGPLPDDKAHHVSFQRPGAAYAARVVFCSEPLRLDIDSDTRAFIGRLRREYARITSNLSANLAAETLRQVMGATVRHLLDDLYDIIREDGVLSPRQIDSLRQTLDRRHPLDAVAYLARRFFECETYLVQEVPP